MSIGLRMGLGLGSNRRSGGGGGDISSSTFSPTVKGTRAVLSNSDRDLTSDANLTATARGTLSRSTGIYYAEFLIVAAGASVPLIGFMDGTTTNTTTLNNSLGGGLTHSVGTIGNGSSRSSAFTSVSSPSLGIWVNGDVAQVAVDFDTGSIWFGKNNTWHGATPAAGTTGRAISFTANTPLFLASTAQIMANSIRICTSLAQQTYAPPPSFSAWD